MWCKCGVNVWSMWWHWGQGTQGTQGMYLLSTNPELIRQVSFLAQANWRTCQWPGSKQPKTQRKNCWKKENASLGRQTDLAFCTAWTSKPNNAIVSTLILGKEQPKNVIFSLNLPLSICHLYSFFCFHHHHLPVLICLGNMLIWALLRLSSSVFHRALNIPHLRFLLEWAFIQHTLLILLCLWILKWV